MKTKTLTLRRFTAECGSPEAAAARVGVAFSTYCRWLNKSNKPKGNNARRLRELGIVA